MKRAVSKDDPKPHTHVEPGRYGAARSDLAENFQERETEDPVHDPVRAEARAAEEGRHADPVPRREPATTFVVNTDGDVRETPGGSGVEDVPRVRDDPRDVPQKRSRTYLYWIGAIALVIVVIAILGLA